MTWTKDGYRHPPCIVCKAAIEMGIRDKVQAGRCHIRGIGDVCAYHYHILTSAMTSRGGRST